MSEEGLKEAQKLFSCQKAKCAEFSCTDPFNEKNTMKGYKCIKRGNMEGSIYITHVNNEEVKGQLIYGTPNLKYPYKNEENEFLGEKSFSGAKQYYLSVKWNGTNILFFKYFDKNGQSFITAKTKGYHTLSDSDFGQFLTNTKTVLKEKPDLLKIFEDKDIQSVSFELCGKLEPHLVKYDFDLDLKPLFKTNLEGKISPILTDKVYEYKYEDMIENCKKYQEKSLLENEEFRKQNNLKMQYEHDHFITEGYVLYVMTSKGAVINRTMYKVKPKDIEEVHHQNFDDKMKEIVKISIKKMKERSIEFNEENLKNELDMGPKMWSKHGRQILKFISEIEPDFVIKRKNEDTEEKNKKVKNE